MILYYTHSTLHKQDSFITASYSQRMASEASSRAARAVMESFGLTEREWNKVVISEHLQMQFLAPTVASGRDSSPT